MGYAGCTGYMGYTGLHRLCRATLARQTRCMVHSCQLPKSHPKPHNHTPHFAKPYPLNKVRIEVTHPFFLFQGRSLSHTTKKVDSLETQEKVKENTSLCHACHNRASFCHGNGGHRFSKWLPWRLPSCCYIAYLASSDLYNHAVHAVCCIVNRSHIKRTQSSGEHSVLGKASLQINLQLASRIMDLYNSVVDKPIPGVSRDREPGRLATMPMVKWDTQRAFYNISSHLLRLTEVAHIHFLLYQTHFLAI